MKRILILILFIVFCASPVFGAGLMIVGGGVEGAPASKTIAHVNSDNTTVTITESTTLTMDAKSHTTGNTLILFAYAEDEGY